MTLQVGIVGLPNVGKSTLFQALTRKMVDINNYPFCTIEPNVGIVEVPDDRLARLAVHSGSRKVIPAVVEFVDIAGLVKGASEGEGLGNTFLATIREVDAILEVIRVFRNPDIVHVHPTIDPEHDRAVIHTELILADLETLAKRKHKTAKDVRGVVPGAAEEWALIERLEQALGAGALAYEVGVTLTTAADRALLRGLQLLTAKPILTVYNVSDPDQALAPVLEAVPHVKLDIKLEEELGALGVAERDELGLRSRLPELIRAAYRLLGLITFFTTGEDETRAWTIKAGATAPEAGAAIHHDFQEQFIRAEVIPWERLLAVSSWSAARESGALRIEGKEYRVCDGDVMVFRI